jgi:hypothetical protein
MTKSALLSFESCALPLGVSDPPSLMLSEVDAAFALRIRD